FVRGQDVDALIFHAEIVEDLDDLTGETALRETRRALHEKHDVVGLHFIVDEIVDAGHLRSFQNTGPNSGTGWEDISHIVALNAGNHPDRVKASQMREKFAFAGATSCRSGRCSRERTRITPVRSSAMRARAARRPYCPSAHHRPSGAA